MHYWNNLSFSYSIQYNFNTISVKTFAFTYNQFSNIINIYSLCIDSKQKLFNSSTILIKRIFYINNDTKNHRSLYSLHTYDTPWLIPITSCNHQWRYQSIITLFAIYRLQMILNVWKINSFRWIQNRTYFLIDRLC